MTWKKALCSTCLLALSALPLGAQSFLAWKSLTPGPYAVGFTTATVVDTTRTIAAPKDYLG
ncbi:MAG: hypothetical protein MUF10_09695, partial [Thermoanaerobaculaceae bacterium]|nr:hypothetical protein [Thermoanaerobaculaceae bacterium]